MTAVRLGQQVSQAVGSGFESLSCQNFLGFIPNIFRKGFFYEIFGIVRQKRFDEKF